MHRAAVFLVVLGLVALAWLYWRPSARASMAETTITGFWEAPAHFCQRADLAGMQIIIGAPRKDASRAAFISAKRADGFIIESDVVIFRPSGRATEQRRGSASWVVRPIRVQGSRILPARMQLCISPERGQMQLEHKGKVYADLFRNAEASVGVEVTAAASADSTSL